MELWPVCYQQTGLNRGQPPSSLMTTTPLDHLPPNPPTASQPHSKLLLQRKSYWSRVGGQHNRLNPIILASLSPCVSPWAPLSLLLDSLPVCFSLKGKVKPVGVVFLLLLAKCLLRKSPGVGEQGSHLSQKHAVERWVMGAERRGGRQTRLHLHVSVIFGCFRLSNRLDNLPVCQNTFLLSDFERAVTTASSFPLSSRNSRLFLK